MAVSYVQDTATLTAAAASAQAPISVQCLMTKRVRWGMIMVVSGPDDVLAPEVTRRLRAAGRSVYDIREEALFSTVPVVWERHGQTVAGFLQREDGPLPLTAISAILLRLPRAWSPSLDLSLQDYTFVYHETMAAWLCIFASLTCPMVNRFAIGWWLNDVTYPVVLRKELAAVLRIALAPHSTVPLPCRAASAGTVSAVPPLTSVYLLDERIIAGAAADAAVLRLLARQRTGLTRWQHTHGVRLCRLDFTCMPRLQLVDVDICPRVDSEPSYVLDRLCAATVEVLS